MQTLAGHGELPRGNITFPPPRVRRSEMSEPMSFVPPTTTLGVVDLRVSDSRPAVTRACKRFAFNHLR